jgi:ribosome recycling factor
VTVEETMASGREKMAKAIEHVREEFSTVRTGRASSALVEKLTADYYGSPTPLLQLATFSTPEARVLLVTPFDPQSLKAVEKAIQTSDLGVNPSNDGKVIRLNFPPLTEDRRKEFVKLVKTRAEDGRIALRNIRRDTKKELEKLEKDGVISKDDLERSEKDLEKLTSEYVTEVDTILGHKEKELLEV